MKTALDPLCSARLLLLTLLILLGTTWPGPFESVAAEPGQLPRLLIAGDSTAANGVPDAIGWGRMFGDYFDPSKVTVLNRARGGRSSRTFVTEGLWEELLAEVQPGDIVLIQFGHNDGGAVNGDKPWLVRGSLPGIGEETEDIINGVTGEAETVYTFGHYIRKMVTDVRDRQAQPILLSLTVRNIWEEGRVERGSGEYREWTRQLAEELEVPFVDLTGIIADCYEDLGQEMVGAFFPKDHTHTSETGARLNAELVVSGLQGLRDQSIIGLLSAAGRLVATADPDQVWVPVRPPPKGDPEAFKEWLNLGVPGDPELPDIILIGDSTVRNGRGDGYDGQFGWGDPFAAFFDPAKVNVINRAVGGLGARTFRQGDNYPAVLEMLKPGDVVIMQFGHNDNGSRGAMPGIGPETEERERGDTGETETVHTFGWYLMQYVAEIRDRGATPVICSLVPRKIWEDGRIQRTENGHADWAREVAREEKVDFIDLHERVARRYDAMGPEAVGPLFADRATHTSWQGAVINATCVVEGLRALRENPVAPYLRLQVHPVEWTEVEPDGEVHRFGWHDNNFTLDGNPMLIRAGEMHFGRVLPEDWDHRLKQAKAMGLNTVSFYLFWNLCEPEEGKFDFTGLTDVARMLELCQENGLWAILRPGPYCCAEVEYGGIPWWTARYPEVGIRSNDPQYVEWSRRYIDAVYRQVADLQVTRGGPLLMVQMENEYGMVARGDNDYLKSLHGIFLDAGFEVPLFTCDPFFAMNWDPGIDLPGVLRGRNGLKNERDLQMTRDVIGSDPAFVTELYTAWFSGWGQPIATRHAPVEYTVEWTSSLLDMGVSFNYYVFHGGTTFGFFNGCNQFLPVQTSYDYSAPVDEAGRATEKYYALRKLLDDRLQLDLPPVPEDPPVVSIPSFRMSPAVSLLDTLPDKPARKAEHPATMEELGQAYGFVLYRKHFPDGIRGTLELRDARDYTIVMVDGEPVARSFVGLGLDSNLIELDEAGPATLDLLVYNLGRISVITSRQTQERARKGLDGGAWLDGAELTGWEMYSLPCDNIADFPEQTAVHRGPTFYRGSFSLARRGGSFLDLSNWGFGVVWVNGHNLGRYWDRGALRSLFVPRHWLREGRNEVVLLELDEAPEVPDISGGLEIVVKEPVPFAVELDRFELEAND